MKKRNLFLTLGLALTLGAGVAGGLSLNRGETKEVGAEPSATQGNVIASNQARVWIGYDTNNPFYSYADANTGIRLWIHSTSEGGDEHVYGTITGTFNNVAEGNKRYDYFDINISDYTNGWYMTVQKFQNNAWKGATNPIQLSASNAFKVYYVHGDWAWDKTQGTVAAGAVGGDTETNTVDAGFAVKALGGMLSCSSSNINGYGAYANFNSTFVKNTLEQWKTKGNMNEQTLLDYSNGDTSYTGSKNNLIDGYTKYQFVQTKAGASNSFYFVPTTNNTNMFIPIAIISIVGLTSVVAGIVVIRRRKEQE